MLLETKENILTITEYEMKNQKIIINLKDTFEAKVNARNISNLAFCSLADEFSPNTVDMNHDEATLTIVADFSTFVNGHQLERLLGCLSDMGMLAEEEKEED